MPIYIHPAAVTVADDTYWYAFMRHTERPEIGYRLELKSVQNIRALSEIVEGRAYAAWRPAAAADTESGLSQSSASNRYYYAFGASDTYVEWTVDADCDALVIGYYQISGASELEVVKNPATDNEVIGTVDTDGTTDADAETTLTGLSLAATDTIRVRRKTGASGNARLVYVYGYDTTTPATESTTTWAMPSTDVLHTAGSSKECAYRVAPTGNTDRWVGGEGHQSGADSNCRETNVTESWANDGITWTPVAGWCTGKHQLHRESDVDYDLTPTVIGTLETLYLFGYDHLSVSTLFTASTDVDVETAYAGMMVGWDEQFDAVKTNGFYVMPTSPAGGANQNVPAGQLAACRDAYFLKTPEGSTAHQDLIYSSHDLSAAFLVRNAAVIHKWYFQIDAPATLANTESIGGKWVLEYTTRYPRYESHVLLYPRKVHRKLYTQRSIAPDLWVDFSRGCYVADAAAIANVVTLDGRLKHFVQATADNKPTMAADGINSLAAASFDGGDYLKITEQLLDGTAGYIFVIGNVTDSGSPKMVLCTGNSASNANAFVVGIDHNETMRLLWQDGAPYNVILGEDTSSGVLLAEYGSDGTSYSFVRDGASKSLTVSNGSDDGNWVGDVTTLTHTTIGARERTGVDQQWLGSLGEIIAYNSAPSGEEIDAVRKYLTDKWGIS